MRAARVARSAALLLLCAVAPVRADFRAWFRKREAETKREAAAAPSVEEAPPAAAAALNAGLNADRIAPWPGKPSSDVGVPLTQIGSSIVSDARSMIDTGLDEFLDVYAKRPDRHNVCGIRINHAFGIWLVTKRLKPTTIIESGVNAGVSTYMFRKAAPSARIISIDPATEPICGQSGRWIDHTNNVYLVGDDFVDLAAVDWSSPRWAPGNDPMAAASNASSAPRRKEKGGASDWRKYTLVYEDDHQNAFSRVAAMQAHGFRHMMLEDNYRPGQVANPLDAYSIKKMLSKADSDAIWLRQQLKAYAEVPPLVFWHPRWAMPDLLEAPMRTGILHPADDTRAIPEPLLRPDVRPADHAILEKIGKRLGVAYLERQIPPSPPRSAREKHEEKRRKAAEDRAVAAGRGLGSAGAAAEGHVQKHTHSAGYLASHRPHGASRAPAGAAGNGAESPPSSSAVADAAAAPEAAAKWAVNDEYTMYVHIAYFHLRNAFERDRVLGRDFYSRAPINEI